MLRHRLFLLAGLLALAASLAAATSLEEAWSLYAGGDLEGAAQRVAELLAASGGEERAAALSLAGTVAAARGDLPGARRLWREAAEGYPASPAGREAAAKLDLLCVLTGCPEGGSEAPPAAPPVPAEPAAPIAASPTPPAVEPPMPPVAPPTVARTATVLVAGQGDPFDAVREATQFLTAFLREQGVDAQSPTEDIAIVQRSEVVLGQLLSAATERGAAGVVVLGARFGHRERVEVTCWSPEGAELWSESVTGGMAFAEEPVRMNGNLMERLTERLRPRLGGPGLPLVR